MQPKGGVVGSDGGLFDQNNFSGLKSILDVPAGGVVGYILTSWDGEKNPVVGFVFIDSHT